MTQPIKVTPSQVHAAKILVKHADAEGREIHPGIRKIAEAKPAAKPKEPAGLE